MSTGSVLLRTLEGCDADHCAMMDELVSQVTRLLVSMVEEFPDWKLEELAAIA